MLYSVEEEKFNMFARFEAIGRLVKDPSEGLRRVTINGEEVSVCTFTIACDGEFKDAPSDFYDCVAWRKTADNLCNFMDKGKLIFIAGRPHTKTWEQDGVKKYRTEYKIDNIKFLERGKGAGAVATSDDTPF